MRGVILIDDRLTQVPTCLLAPVSTLGDLSRRSRGESLLFIGFSCGGNACSF